MYDMYGTSYMEWGKNLIFRRKTLYIFGWLGRNDFEEIWNLWPMKNQDLPLPVNLRVIEAPPRLILLNQFPPKRGWKIRGDQIDGSGGELSVL